MIEIATIVIIIIIIIFNFYFDASLFFVPSNCHFYTCVGVSLLLAYFSRSLETLNK